MKTVFARKLSSALSLAAITTLLCTSTTVSAITVTTTNGSGADVQLTGWGGPNADPTNAVDSAANNDQINIRYTTNRSEIMALRVDLTGHTLANNTNYTIQFVNQRANSAATLLYYAVTDGTVGEDNNGSTPGYTDNNWVETTVLFSTMPGLHWTNTAPIDQTINANTVSLGSAAMNNLTEGSLVSFTSQALNDFLQTNADNVVTFIVLRTDANGTQARFATKEATNLNSGATGTAGDFAPRLKFSANGCDPAVVTANPASLTNTAGTTANFAVTATGTTPSYQWQVRTNGTTAWFNIVGETADTYAIAATSTGESGNQYRCVVSVTCDPDLAISASATLTVTAQANWTGSADTDWNNLNNWDTLEVPGFGTNAIIGSSFTVNYNAPMVAPSFASLNLSSMLTVNTNNFIINTLGAATAPVTVSSGGVLTVAPTGVLTASNCGPVTVSAGGLMDVSGSVLLRPATATTTNAPLTLGGTLNVQSNGSLTISVGGTTTVSAGGVLMINTNGAVTISNGGSLSLPSPTSGTSAAIGVEGGSLILTNSSANVLIGSSDGSDANIGSRVTNNFGTIIFDRQADVRGRDTRFIMNGGFTDFKGGINHNTTGNDARQWFQFSGGTANLNAVTINRATLNTGGILVSGGTVNSTSIRIGTGVASGNSRMDSGIWTNTGAFYIGDRNNPATGSRRTYFVMNGGELVTLGSEGIVINNQGQTTLAAPTDDGGTLDVNGGTIITEGIYLNGPSVSSNAYARFELSGSSTVYLGTVGLVANTGLNKTAEFTITGGTLGAKADWTSSATLPLGGTITFKAADSTNAPHNITLNGALSGAGAGLVKTGGGVLTLNGTNTYAGATTINEGRLTLGASGSLSSPSITVASGAVFDVSAFGGFNFTSGKTLSGVGTVVGSVTNLSGSILVPGSTIGVLTFSNGLAQTGGVADNFDLSGATNDTIEVVGDLTVSGVNNINITAVGGTLPAGTYKLFHYTGTLNGGTNNFTVSGAPGFLTNNVAAKTISLITIGIRAATNITWVGGALNNWDVANLTNWLNGASLDAFVQGDFVRFDATGAANPAVNVAQNVNPGSVTVDATGNYTFAGTGNIGASGGVTKTNTGTLSLLTTNSYTGATIVGQGTLQISSLANAGLSSSIGAAGTSTNNLVLGDGTTLRYVGTASGSTDRGATLDGSMVTVDVPGVGIGMTVAGTVTGPAAVTKTGPGVLTLSGANSYAGGTVVSNGVFSVGAATSAGSGAIAILDGTTLRMLGGSYTVANNVDFSGTTKIDLNSQTGVRNLAGTWTGNATIFITNVFDSGSTFSIGGLGGMSGLSGVIDFGNSTCHLRINHDDASPNTGSPNVHLKLGSGNVIVEPRNGGFTMDFGAVEGGPNTILRGRASGAGGLITYSIGALNLDTVFAGSLSNSTTSGSLTALTKVGTGKLTLTGTNVHSGATLVSAGTLQVDGLIINSSSVSVDAGTLAGTGTIKRPVTVNSGGTLSPGASPGTLTISNTLVLSSGSTTFMEIDAGNNTNDLAAVSSTITYGGTLNVTNLSGTLAAGQVYKLFNAANDTSYLGEFDGGTNLPPLSGSLAWDTTGLATNGTISVYSAISINPNPTNITFTAGGGNLTLAWPSDHIGWTLQTQTNTRAVGLNTNWFDVDGSSTTNAVTLPVDATSPTVFYRLFYFIP